MTNTEKIMDFLQKSRTSDKKKKQEKELKMMTESYHDKQIEVMLSMYGVSIDTLEAYQERYGKYPPFFIMETEERKKVREELRLFDRMLKIQRIKDKITTN